MSHSHENKEEGKTKRDYKDPRNRKKVSSSLHFFLFSQFHCEQAVSERNPCIHSFIQHAVELYSILEGNGMGDARHLNLLIKGCLHTVEAEKKTLSSDVNRVRWGTFN